ncbi:hypothetical protein ACSVHK_16780 [Acinetobacter nosocomialis]|uniref:Transposase n=1 Tax=Acinetobacter nosocomialis TaxID=106654 RepID=A0AB36M5G8_ACINO|nr:MULTISPECIES: hypothetical protein [Acinetobacter]KCZ33623.1 hypothetical protein J812_1148 [Acinetobacter baumannii 25977_9]EXT39885.1 hypothetical protein J811_1012 [Acinetobacter sp. 25977_8]EXT46893.1 hypothetical protein J810_0606 [Acinetobacter sp. 25977_7]EXT48414.1 hypothetical protein J809_0598 [Acinetobacter sp. 25977_6]EXT52415.1 hypothetical protein J807_0889 [Acinetobacter sp. 25977_4]
MFKKKDSFSKKLKLTAKEKNTLNRRMSQIEVVLLYWVQVERKCVILYRYFIYLGALILPNKQTKQKLYKIALGLIKQFAVYIFLPSICKIFTDILVTAYSNNFML